MAERAADLVALVDDASVLIVNGDSRNSSCRCWRTRLPANSIAPLDLPCPDTRLVLLAGNHDPELTDLRHLILAGGDLPDHPRRCGARGAAPGRTRRRSSAIAIAKSCSRAVERETTCRRSSRPAARPRWRSASTRAIWTADQSAGSCKPWKIAAITAFWWTHAQVDSLRLHHAPPLGSWPDHPTAGRAAGRRTIVNTGCFGFPSRLGVLVSSEGSRCVDLPKTRWKPRPGIGRDPSRSDDFDSTGRLWNDSRRSARVGDAA